MRQLARFVQILQKNGNEFHKKTQTFFIDHFDEVVHAVKALCEAKNSYMEKLYGEPSLAFKIRHTLNKISNFLKRSSSLS